MSMLLVFSLALCATTSADQQEPLGWIMPESLFKEGGTAQLVTVPPPLAPAVATVPPIALPPVPAMAPVATAEAPPVEKPAHVEPHEVPQIKAKAAEPEHAAKLAAEHGAGHEEHAIELGEQEVEHGGEGGEHEAESEEAVDDVTWTTALLLIGFLVIGVGLLYLVNYPDEDIRVAMWDMINTTVSIFCGASFDFSVFRFLHNQIVLSPPPRGLGFKEDTPHIKSTMSFVLAVAVAVVLHVLLFKLHEQNHRLLFAVRTMGGHVYAFACILCFGFLQEVHVIRDSLFRICLVAVTAIAAMSGAYKIALWVAKSQDDGTWWRKIKIQRKNAEEMQIEAGAIAGGFLIVQCICYFLSVEKHAYHRFMPILHGEPGKHVERCVEILIGVSVLLLIGSAVWAIALRPTGRKEKPCIGSFLHDYLGTLCAVTACWCLQRAGHIFLYQHFSLAGNSLEMASSRSIIVNAFVMSLLSVVCVCVFDKIADCVQKRQTACGDVCDNFGIDEEEVARTLSMVSSDADLANVGIGLRTMIAGFGMLVGICWDKAFETAFETVAEKLPGMHRHPVIGTGIVSGILLAFVIPAWFWYIVPNAMKKEQDHADDMDREREREMKARKSLQSVEFSTEEEESDTVF